MKEMTDRYERIRKALEMGPTPGPWGFTELPRDMQRDGYKFAISRRGIGWRFAQIAHEMNSMANAAYITACDPDTIRALLGERDALLDALRQIAEWPDGGNRYGQENIKRFARHTIDAAMQRTSGGDHG